MAINVLQQPGTISFSGDPIIAKAKTTLVGKTFLRITLQCNVEMIRGDEEQYYTESYTYLVGSDGIATFNVGNTLLTAFEKYTKQEVENKVIAQHLYSARLKLTYKELFFDGLIEVEGTTVVSEWYNAVMGSLTEYERMRMPNADTSSVIGYGRMLTRKPVGEIVSKGIDLYVPAISTVSESIGFDVVQGSVSKNQKEYTGGINVPISLKITTDALSLGTLRVDTSFDTGRLKHVVEESSSMRHFLFLNGFGLIESITATMREALKYTIDSELFIIPGEISFKGHTRVVSYTQTPKVEIDMSSGYVNREWGEWWVNEFVATRRAWMLLDGSYIPVAIIPEESNKLFDRSKPGLMAVQFKVQYSFSGGTFNSFLK